ncbi:MAG TPA: hypothetical protein VJ550_16990 [Geomonas sp.]|nr:hypothetical protein [Geomonas sp.]
MNALFRGVGSCLVVALCGCSLGISRIGYSVAEPQVTVPQCNVPIKLKAHFKEGEVKTLGTVIAHDHYLSAEDCDIESVLDKIKRDACYLGADLINITEEKQPDYNWSICYRVNADFIKLINAKDARNLESDPQYDWGKVKEEGARSREKGKNAYWKALGSGIIGGLP